MKTNLVLILLVLFFSILISLPLLKSGLYEMHDDQHVARLYLFDKSVREGQVPVRWVDELGFGFGYPLFVFYPPFVYMLGEVFHLVGFGFIDSIKLVFFFSIFGSGLAMYILGRKLWGRLAGLTSALFYLILPYRALDLYVRGALAEAFSFVWLPLILWSFHKLFEAQKLIYIYLSATFLALLMITHNLIFLPFMLILPIYLLFLFLKTPERKLFAVNCLISIVLAFGLSGFFWIPAIFEKKFTLVDQLLLTNLADFRIHFVYLQQLWNWTWGFGGSAQGLADGISFKIGKLHILVSVVAFVLAAALLKKNRRFLKLSTFNFQLSTVFFALFIFSAFMTTSYSKIVWELIHPLSYLQFPWRFLMFSGLFTSLLAGALIYFLRVAIFRLIAFVVLVIVLLLPNLKLFKPQNYRLNLTDEQATDFETVFWDISKTSFEYVPKGVALKQDERGVSMIDLDEADIPQNKIKLISGEADFRLTKNESDEVSFYIATQQDSIIKANIFNFPGWKVPIDNKKTTIDDNNDLKLITFTVPKGNHEIKIKFENTNVRTYANMLTLGSIAFLIMLMLRQAIKRSGGLRSDG